MTTRLVARSCSLLAVLLSCGLAAAEPRPPSSRIHVEAASAPAEFGAQTRRMLREAVERSRATVTHGTPTVALQHAAQSASARIPEAVTAAERARAR